MVSLSKSQAAWSSTILIAGLICAGVIAKSDWPHSTPKSVSPASELPQVARTIAQGVATSDKDFQALPYVVFFSSSTLSRRWGIADDRKSLRITTHELFPQGVVGEFSQDISSALTIRDIAPRGGNEIFVGGNPQRGGFVIERWKLPNVRGSTTATLVPPGTPAGTPVTTPAFGVPTQPWGGQVFIPGGVSQLPIGQRISLPPAQKSAFAEDANVLYRGIGADPEGRFVLVVTDNGELRQYFPSTTLDDYMVLATSASLPGLEHIEGLFFRAQHAAFGRVWFLTWDDPKHPDGTMILPPLYQTVVLVDTDNDGVFDEITSHLVDGTTIDPYLDRTFWLDDFMGAP